jgi:hypothetical protein
MTEEQKKLRREAKELAKELQRIENEKNQLPVDRITINIEWKKSRIWGANPHCSAHVVFKNGHSINSPVYTASGCGYDKESTVVADVFNAYLKYKIWNKTIEQCKRTDYDWREKGGAPYGVSAGTWKTADTKVEYRSFSGGIGTNCYKAISEFLGGKFENVASGKTFDVFTYKENE